MIKRGDIYFIRDTRQSIGSEQKADRPAVIVSNDANNKHSGVYEVVYMTTRPKTRPANTFYNKFRVENINRLVRADKQRLQGTDRRMDRNTHTGRNETA